MVIQRLVATACGLLLTAIGCFLFWVWHDYTSPKNDRDQIRFVIEPGTTANQVASQLVTLGVLESSWIFRLGARFDDLTLKIQSGEFLLNAGLSTREILHHFAFGKTVQRSLMVPEGVTKWEVAELVNSSLGLKGTVNARDLSEGSLFPDTYFYSWGDTRSKLIERMKAKMGQLVEKTWAARNKASVLRSPKELVTLASIIEKEARLPSELTRISAVFNNRLKLGMRLQADPTVIYALTKGTRKLGRGLSRADLKLSSLYNTYLVAGLPPGPIANPGEVSLRAAAQPASTDDLYFVADGKGGHLFARTLEQHNINVAKWRLLKRNEYR
ncbi:MAG: endolytic transglycosylase MltG [Pseudomonadota bacterium]|nr:endolytic transglycosylase MltG [Pseudomonadota bacterium]